MRACPRRIRTGGVRVPGGGMKELRNEGMKEGQSVRAVRVTFIPLRLPRFSGSWTFCFRSTGGTQIDDSSPIVDLRVSKIEQDRKRKRCDGTPRFDDLWLEKPARVAAHPRRSRGNSVDNARSERSFIPKFHLSIFPTFLPSFLHSFIPSFRHSFILTHIPPESTSIDA